MLPEGSDQVPSITSLEIKIMRRFTALMAAVAATFAMSSAQALVIVVDNFNTPPAGVQVIDATGDGNTTIAAYGDATRSIFHRLDTLTAVGVNATGLFSSVGLAGGTIPPGNLQMRNADTVTSTVSLNWTLAPGIVPAIGPVSFYFTVYNSDAVTKNIEASIGGTPIAGFMINEVIAPGELKTFVVSGVDQALLAAGGVLGMTFTGSNGWDISIDEIGFIIPEPTSLALAGLALVGAGLASRRRKAA